MWPGAWKTVMRGEAPKYFGPGRNRHKQSRKTQYDLSRGEVVPIYCRTALQITDQCRIL